MDIKGHSGGQETHQARAKVSWVPSCAIPCQVNNKISVNKN